MSGEMRKISVCAIAYNGYGEFVPRWLKAVQMQTYPAYEIIVVLGRDHGLPNILAGARYIYHDQPATMGFLRNLAVDAATGDYLFFCDVDDMLLPNALQEIRTTDADIVALQYYLKGEICITPEVVAEKLLDWRLHYTGAFGYMAFKKGLRHEDTDWPNYPLLFQAYKKGYTYKQTKGPCAVYLQRANGHGQNPENHKKGFAEIEKYLLQYNLIPGNSL